MILTPDFCSIQDLRQEEHLVEAGMHWQENHPIFKGHFPGQPVVPGVCMMQMVKQVLETAWSVRLELVESGSIKFLLFIDPRQQPKTQLLVKRQKTENGLHTISAQITDGDKTFFKFNAVYRQIMV